MKKNWKLYFLNGIKTERTHSLTEWHDIFGHCSLKDIVKLETAVKGMKMIKIILVVMYVLWEKYVNIAMEVPKKSKPTNRIGTLWFIRSNKTNFEKLIEISDNLYRWLLKTYHCLFSERHNSGSGCYRNILSRYRILWFNKKYENI